METGKIKQATLQFVANHSFYKRDAEKLRGYFGNLYKEEDLFHNHNPDGSALYRMPLIQYKVIKGVLTIIGYNEAIPVLADKFLQVKQIEIGNKKVPDFETRFTVKPEFFKVCDDLYSYYFDTFWLSVNQKNHAAYESGTLDLNKVLTNNILTNFKGLGITVKKKIMVKGKFTPVKIPVKNITMTGFKGKFVCNVHIPDYMAVGKHRAIGFGCVVKEGK